MELAPPRHMASFEWLWIKHDYSMKNNVELTPQLGQWNNKKRITTKEQVKHNLSYLSSSNYMQESLDFIYEH
jgi:hypothetical protein